MLNIRFKLDYTKISLECLYPIRQSYTFKYLCMMQSPSTGFIYYTYNYHILLYKVKYITLPGETHPDPDNLS